MFPFSLVSFHETCIPAYPPFPGVFAAESSPKPEFTTTSAFSATHKSKVPPGSMSIALLFKPEFVNLIFLNTLTLACTPLLTRIDNSCISPSTSCVPISSTNITDAFVSIINFPFSVGLVVPSFQMLFELLMLFQLIHFRPADTFTSPYSD